MKPSEFLSVNVKDVANGLILAVLTAVVSVIYSTLQAGTFVINWMQLWHVALIAAIAYLKMQFFSGDKPNQQAQ